MIGTTASEASTQATKVSLLYVADVGPAIVAAVGRLAAEKISEGLS